MHPCGSRGDRGASPRSLQKHLPSEHEASILCRRCVCPAARPPQPAPELGVRWEMHPARNCTLIDTAASGSPGWSQGSRQPLTQAGQRAMPGLYEPSGGSSTWNPIGQGGGLLSPHALNYPFPSSLPPSSSSLQAAQLLPLPLSSQPCSPGLSSLQHQEKLSATDFSELRAWVLWFLGFFHLEKCRFPQSTALQKCATASFVRKQNSDKAAGDFSEHPLSFPLQCF